MKVSNLLQEIEKTNCRSHWAKGVKAYAVAMVKSIDPKKEVSYRFIESELLNGARDWNQYSEGGCALIYDRDIAERLCTPSELKRLTRSNGSLKDRPNSRENWIQCQARALFQACELVSNIVRMQINRANKRTICRVF